MEIKKSLAIVMLYLFVTSVAADVVYKDGIIYIRNMLTNDHLEFKKILSDKQVTKIIFENCYGGIAYTGYQIAKEIERKELNTYFKGVVGSSCAIAFMGGKNRYSDKSDFFYKNILMFQAIRGKKNFTEEEIKMINQKFNIDLKDIKNINDEGIKKSTNFAIEYINSRTKNNIPEILKEHIKNSTKSTDGVVFESKFTLFGESKNLYFCSEDYTTQQYNYCPEIKNISFEKTNVISK